MERKKKALGWINILLIVIYIILIAAGTFLTVKVENLFIQFLGTTIAIFSLYNLIVMWHSFRQFRHLTAGLNTPASITALTETDMRLIPDKNITVLPMTEHRIIFYLTDNAEQIRCTENIEFTKHDDGTTVGIFHIPQIRHGDFLFNKCRICVRPVLSLWDFTFPIECPCKIRILPKYSDGQYETTHINYGDTDGTSHKSMQSSTDLFDNRKYYPGDDPRKINWKIFSHTGELQIRQSEHTATNYGNQNIIFMPLTADIEEYERITTVFVGICQYLLKNDIKLNILSPLQEKPLNVTAANISRLDDIVNGSYKDFGNHITQTEYQIAIGSPTQLCRLLSSVKLTDSIIMSINVDDPQKNKSPMFIRHHDLLAADIRAANKEKKLFKEKTALLDELKQLSAGNKLELY